jgi:hypothetical protein
MARADQRATKHHTTWKRTSPHRIFATVMTLL